jgi:hypothetical protein
MEAIIFSSILGLFTLGYFTGRRDGKAEGYTAGLADMYKAKR